MPTAAWTIPAKLPKKPVLSTEMPDFFGTTAPGGPAGTPARIAKTPGADPLVFEQFDQVSRLGDTIDATTAPFFAALTATQPALAAATGQETANLDAVYSPNGYQATLQAIRDARKKAFAGLNQQMLADLRRTLGLGRIGAGGAVGGGLSSLLARIAAAESGKLRAQEAVDAATQERADTGALATMRAASQGQRQTLTDALLSRLLTPIDVEAKAGSTYSDALTRALQQIQINSYMGLGGRA